MSVDSYQQMSTGVSDITSIALVILEIINNTLLINELRLWFVCRELMGNLVARKHWLDINLELHTEIFKLRLHDISRIMMMFVGGVLYSCILSNFPLLFPYLSLILFLCRLQKVFQHYLFIKVDKLLEILSS